MHQLSAGSCERIFNTTSPGDPVLSELHTLQILSIKLVNSNMSTGNPVDRYRIIMSDGIHYFQAMLATQLNPYVQDKRIERHSVVTIEKMTSNPMNGKQYGIFLIMFALANDA
jgi:replication factor A1